MAEKKRVSSITTEQAELQEAWKILDILESAVSRKLGTFSREPEKMLLVLIQVLVSQGVLTKENVKRILK